MRIDPKMDMFGAGNDTTSQKSKIELTPADDGAQQSSFVRESIIKTAGRS